MYWVVALLFTQIKQECGLFESMIKFVIKWQSPQVAFKIPNATSLATETLTYTFWECSCYLQIMKLWVSHYIWLVLFFYLIIFCKASHIKTVSSRHKGTEYAAVRFPFSLDITLRYLEKYNLSYTCTKVNSLYNCLPIGWGNIRFFGTK